MFWGSFFFFLSFQPSIFILLSSPRIPFKSLKETSSWPACYLLWFWVIVLMEKISPSEGGGGSTVGKPLMFSSKVRIQRDKMGLRTS
jgi:hypothetical protein